MLKLSNFLYYTFNLLMALVLFVLFLPFIVFIYLKLRKTGEKKPIFKQIRIGKNEKEFIIYKFKTMIDDANKEGPFICSNYEDPRITEFGKYLRRKKLDELPQLINIIRGDMNFVGPRPEIPYFHKINSEKIANWKERVSVKPGITGPAQLSTKVSHNPNEKIIEDLVYIKNRTFFLDLKFIYLTAYYFFKGRIL